MIHIDCYREDNINRWIKIGFHDYLNLENIVIIEWADKIPSLLPNNYIRIEFIHEGKNKRNIILKTENFFNILIIVMIRLRIC